MHELLMLITFDL